MPTWYLRIEAVNILEFTADAQELSTVRGGSMLLLDAPLHGVWAAAGTANIRPLSTGASIGVYSFEGDAETAGRVVGAARDFFKNDHRYCHATILVNAAPADDFDRGNEELLAITRWQQMRSPSVAFPSPVADPPGPAEPAVCEVDLIRPWTDRLREVRDRKLNSASVAARRRFGRDEKQRFVSTRAGIEDNAPRFTRDFTELGSEPGPRFGKLANKIAVIHTDGNSFTKIIRSIRDDASPQDRETLTREFDEHLRGCRRQFLHGLIQTTRGKPAWTFYRRRDDGAVEPVHRLELLLWGGDEFILVVPAWTAWAALESFYTAASGWAFRGHHLTHAAGVVFCHQNAPIHAIVKLARNLTEAAKSRSRKQDLVSYAVLESFDHVGERLDRFLAKHCPDPAARNELIVSSAALPVLRGAVTALKAAEFPHRKIHEMVRLRLAGQVKEAEQTWVEMGAEDNGWAAPVGRLRRVIPNDTAVWLHLAELWDYLE